MYKNVVTSLDEFFVFEPTILPQLRADLILGLHTIFANYLLYKMISMPIPDSEIGGQIQPHPDCATTVVGRASTNRAVRTQRKSRKIEEGCKRSHIAAALPSPPREGVGLGQQQQDGVGYPRQSPESNSEGEAVDVALVGLKTAKYPVAAAFMSEQKCVSCAELCNTEHVSLQVNGAQSTRLVRSSEIFGPRENGMGDEPVQFESASLLPDLSLTPNDTPESDTIESIHLEGSDAFQQRLRTLLGGYRDTFARSVRRDPAKVAPMELVVDANKLKLARLSGRARPLSEIRLATLRTMLGELLRLGVVRTSKEARGSQVLLVAKKGTEKLRFCIDYRAINDATQSPEGWPIPNISEMLREIGRKNGRIFGVMDLTSGYHQTPIREADKRWTAFITPDGMYEWNRVPMGIKAAPSYFSRQIMFEVLGDLLYRLVISYLDDLIVWGADEDDFLANLEQVLARLRIKGITLNPDKCRFGLVKVEFVGHTIDGLTGQVHFTRDKLDRVRDFPRPETKGELKQFIGLANYFRAHVKSMSSKTHPMDQLLGGYQTRIRHNKLNWTPEAIAAFESVRHDIDTCPKLSFINPDWRIWLRTDASMFGIGAYLFQISDTGEEIPIEFLSKSLTLGQDLKWSIPEKEAYAIFYAIKKWDHLLRDVRFVLETDHENLTYLNFEGTDKVRRWKMLVMEFDFDIRFLAGVKNNVADALSRLCKHERLEWKHRVEEEAASGGGGVGPDAAEAEDIGDGLATEMVCMLQELEEDLFPIDDEVAIPEDIREQIKLAHNAMVGHSGVQRTVLKLKRLGSSFPNMRDWVDKFIKQCPICQKEDCRTFPVGVTPFTSATYKAMQRIQVDSIGPLPASEEGYAFVFVMIDTFTRWVMLYPIVSTGARECVSAMIQHIGIFGAPKEIVSDGGSQIVNSTIRETLKILEIEHHINVAYSSEENGIVERSNKEVMRYLRAICFDERRGADWAIVLPFAQRICNSEVVSSMGYAPATLVFGTAISLDRGILTPNQLSECGHTELTPYVKQLVDCQRHSLQVAAKIQLDLDTEHLAKRGSTVTEFGVGSYVLVEYPDKGLRKGPPNKLMTHLKGPMVVLSYQRSDYTVRDLSTNAVKTVHVGRLRPFRYDASSVDPKEIAAADIGEFLVEAVIDHKPKGFKRPPKADLKFLIKWLGYDTSENTWEPWKNLRTNSIIHAYCRANDMTSIISTAYDAEQSD